MWLDTPSRSAPPIVRGSMSTTAASSSSSIGCAASQRSSSWASGERRSTRSMRASRSVGGSAPCPSTPLAISSSVNSAVPSERLWSRSALAGGGGGVAGQLGEQGAQRVAAVQLVGAVGADHEQPLAAEHPRQVAEERARGSVGPVEVLDDQHDRRVLA